MRFRPAARTGPCTKRIDVEDFSFRPERPFYCKAGRECVIQLDAAAAAQLIAFDKMVLREAEAHSVDWFGRRMTASEVAQRYTPLVSKDWTVCTRKAISAFYEDKAGLVRESTQGSALPDLRVKGLWVCADRFGVDASTHTLVFQPSGCHKRARHKKW